MSRKITKKDKIKIQERRQEAGGASFQYEYQAPTKASTSQTVKVLAKSQAQASDLLAYDVSLIKKDLLKTVGVTLLVVVLLVALAWYL